MATTSLSQLTPLLSPTPYLLAYALPLLLISLLLTFTGTFLTLDRSRSFPPADRGSTKGYASLTPGRFPALDKKKRKLVWFLEGGIGGLAGGYAFGVHLATALALIIPATSSAASLSPKSFLAVWILTCVVTTILAGRYRYAALAFLGISGGTLTGLAICIITHPALSSRIILVGLFLPLFTVLVLLCAILPVPRLNDTFLHPLLRLFTASTGSFGLVLSVALLLSPQEEGWANAWERLWLKTSPQTDKGMLGWGTGQEQGLSTAYVVFLISGAAGDWALRRWIGECPDQKWDNYLTNYAANLPNQADRAGTFQPLTSFWDRLFSSGTPKPPFGPSGKRDILFPNEVDMKRALHPNNLPLPLPVTMRNAEPTMPQLGPTGSKEELKKGKKGKRSKKEADLDRVPSVGAVERLKKKRGTRAGGWRIANLGSEGSSEGRKERKPVKFGEVSDSSDSDDTEETKKASESDAGASRKPPLGHSYTSSSTPTLVDAHGSAKVSSKTKAKPSHRVSAHDYALDSRLDALATLDYDAEIAQLKGRFSRHDDEGLEYSDYETEMQEVLAGRQGGISRAQPSPQAEQDRAQGKATAWSPGFLQRHQSSRSHVHAPAPTPVPATPSLIRALDRLALAQRDAFGDTAAVPSPSPLGAGRTSTPDEDAAAEADSKAAKAKADKKTERAPRWEEFWREVRVKAQT